MAGEVYNLGNGEYKIVKHLLESDSPQSKDALRQAGVTLHPNLQNALKEHGLLSTYKRLGVSKTVFFTVETDHYHPDIPASYYKKGESIPRDQLKALKLG